MFSSASGPRSLFPLVVRMLASTIFVLGVVLGPAAPAYAANACQLNSAHGSIQHVIYI